MNDLERVAVVIALVGAFRARNVAGHLYVPFLEGNAVPLAAALVGAALCAVGDPSLLWLALAGGVVLGTTAVGVMTTLTYAGDHVGTALVRALVLARPRPGEARAYVDETRSRDRSPYA